MSPEDVPHQQQGEDKSRLGLVHQYLSYRVGRSTDMILKYGDVHCHLPYPPPSLLYGALTVRATHPSKHFTHN